MSHQENNPMPDLALPRRPDPCALDGSGFPLHERRLDFPALSIRSLFLAGIALLCLSVNYGSLQSATIDVADADLAERVRATLVSVQVLSVEKDEIRVEVEDRAVTLTGCAESKAARDEMDLRIRLIPGVTSLENRLRIGCP